MSTEEDVAVLLTYFFDEDLELDDDSGPPVIKVPNEAVVRTVKRFMVEREAQRREAAAAEDPHTLKADEVVGGESGVGSGTRSRGGAAGGGGGGGAGGATAGFGAQSTISVESDRARARREEREFWQRLANVIPAKSIRVWKVCLQHTQTHCPGHWPLPFTHSLDTLPPQALERCLGEYTQILTERSQLIDDVDSLREQNQELKSVLNHYLSAPVRGPPHRQYNVQPLLKLNQTNPFFGVHVFLVYTGQPRTACATNTSHPHRCRRTIELKQRARSKVSKVYNFSISD